MKKKMIIVIAILALVSLAWGLKKYFSSTSMPEAPTVAVRVTHVNQVSLPLEIKAIGNLVARSVEITSEVAGHVEAISFQDGAYVNKSDLLIQLDDKVYQAQYNFAAAELAYSKNNYKRMTILGKQGAIAKQAIDQADSELKEKKANAEEREVMVNKMKLLAPFAGVVGKRKVHVGDYVTVGQSVVTLTDTKHLHIEYNVPEKYLSLLKIGQEVKVISTAYPDKIFSGKLAFISPTVNSSNRSVSLYADVPNDSNQLAAGMLVEVTQSLGAESSVVMVPARSLVPVLDGEQIYTVVNGKALAVSVSTGKRTKGRVQILSGLSPGAVIITDGQLKVKNGTIIKIKT